MKALRLLIPILLLLLPLGLRAQSVLLLSTGSSSLDTQTQSVLSTAGFSVTIGNPFHTFTSSELSGIDIVLLFPNNNWSSGDMSTDAQTALVSFVQAGGGLVTSEWTNWKVGSGSFAILQDILPVVSSTQYTGGSTITYTQSTADSVINAGLPTSMTFTGDSFAGVESYFTPQTGATVFYTSTGGAGGSGIVGWDVQAGRVIQFSTVVGPTQLADSNYSLLLENTVKWAAVPEPSTVLLLTLGLGLIAWVSYRRRVQSSLSSR